MSSGNTKKILWLSWKDIYHPITGGAEVVADALLSRLIKDGHDVTLLTSLYSGASHTDTIHGYNVIRVGGRFSVYWHVYKYYIQHLRNKHDILIEEINTIPFFSQWYATQKPTLFFHQLCREIWFYQMFFPLNVIGYCIEPIYLWLLRDRKVITVSTSSKNDLMRYGFASKNISIISEGVELEPIQNLETVIKYEVPTMLSLGAVRPMKRTDHILQAFEIAKKSIPDLQLIIAGDMSGKYGEKVARLQASSPFSSSIKCLGRVSKEEKISLMQKSHVLAVTSIKEGWGLIVTEANSQGTPAIVYDVDGLRDSVRHMATGLVTAQNTPRSLAESVVELLGKKKSGLASSTTTEKGSAEYGEPLPTLRHSAHTWSKAITFDTQYEEFKKAINI